MKLVQLGFVDRSDFNIQLISIMSITVKSIILLNIMCPQLSLPEWQGTKIPLVAEMEKKKNLGRKQAQSGD